MSSDHPYVRRRAAPLWAPPVVPAPERDVRRAVSPPLPFAQRDMGREVAREFQEARRAGRR